MVKIGAATSGTALGVSVFNSISALLGVASSVLATYSAVDAWVSDHPTEELLAELKSKLDSDMEKLGEFIHFLNAIENDDTSWVYIERIEEISIDRIQFSQ